jgi:hypothetical protein
LANEEVAAHDYPRTTEPWSKAVFDATGGKPFVLVITPYGPGFEHVFPVIRNAVKSLGLSCIRASDVIAPGPGYDLLGTIQIAIKRAELVTADLSHRNPNVLYELAYAAATNKPRLFIAGGPIEVPLFAKGVEYLHYQRLGERAQAQEFTTRLRKALQARLTPPEGIPSEIALRGYEEGAVTVEDYANFLRDLVFLHDHLWIAASDEARTYDLSAGYFYTRRGRPVPESQRLVLTRASIGSPFDLQMVIPSATLIASIAVTYYQLVQAHRTRKLLPGEMRRQVLDEEKLRRELDGVVPKVDSEAQHRGLASGENQRALRELLRQLPQSTEERDDKIVRVVQHDLDRISGSPIKITEVVVVRTVKPEK